MRLPSRLRPAVRSTRSLRARLHLALGLGIVLLLVAGATGIGALAYVDAAEDRLHGVVEPLLARTTDVLQLMTDAETAERGFLLSGDPAFLLPYETAVERIGPVLSEARSLAGGDSTLRRLVDAEAAAAMAWLEEFAEPVIALGRTDLGAARARAASGEGRIRFDALRRANAELTTAAQERGAAEGARVARAEAGARLVLAGVVLAGAALAVLVTRAATRSVTEPVDELRTVLARLRSGELDARATPAGAGELRSLAGALNELAAEQEWLTEGYRAQVTQERLTRSIGMAVHTQLDAEGTMARAAAELGAALGVERVAIRTVVDGRVGGRAASWVRPGGMPSPVDTSPDWLASLPATLSARVRALLEEGGTVALGDDVDPASREHLEANGTRAVLASAVPGPAGPVALVFLHDSSPARRWTATDVAVVQGVGRELATALAHAELYEQQLDAVARLHERDRARDAFLDALTDELRAPLRDILTQLTRLRHGEYGDLADVQRRVLAVADRESRRLLVLVDDLVTLTRATSGDPAAAGDVDLVAAVAGARRSAAEVLSQREVDLRVELPALRRPVRGDTAQVERAVLRLLERAAHVTPRGGRIDLVALERPGAVDLTVRDGGGPLPPHDVRRLLTDLPGRGSAAARQGATGLGLVFVRRIAEAHGGGVQAHPEAGRGTAVTVTLPTARGAEPRAPLRRSRGRSPQALPWQLGGTRGAKPPERGAFGRENHRALRWQLGGTRGAKPPVRVTT